jgi:hypothetical protein
MLGKATAALGGVDEIVDKIGEAGIDLSSLTDIDGAAVTALLEEKGIDLSILEKLGLSVDDVIEKVKERLA